MKASTGSRRSERTPGEKAIRSGKTRTGRRTAGAGRKKTQTARTRRSAAAGKGRLSENNGKRRKRRTYSRTAFGETFLTQNRLSMFLVGLVVVILMVAVSVNAISLNRKLHENRARARILEQELRTEEQRAADIEDYRRYTETDAYIEEIAREKLGLIYEGETVFKEEK